MPDDELIDLVRRDVLAGLSHAFDERDDGWHPVPELVAEGVMSNGQCAAIPWEFPCTHARSFLDVDPTNIDLTIRGVTIVLGEKEDDVLLHRYIDWAQVMSDLRMHASFRPALDARVE